MLVRMLISKGFACREAEDGMEGLSEMSRMYLASCSGSMKGHVSPAPSRRLLSTSSYRFSQQRLVSSQEQQAEQMQRKQHNFSIDAVLIDSNMPRMNGPEAIVEMRKIGFRSPIIGVSGGDEKTMKEFLKAGADNVMQKPVQSDKLVDLLLTGLDLVVQESTSSLVERSLVEGHIMRASEQAWHGRIQHLRQFIENADGAAVKK